MTQENKSFLIEYGFEGARWGAEIKAASAEEAKARIAAMAAFGQVKGEIMAAIPAGGGIIVRAWTWLANTLRL